MRKFLLFFILFICIATSIVYFSLRFEIDEICCLSQYGPCRGDIEKKLVSMEGNNIFKTHHQVKEFLSEHPYVNSFNIKLKLPSIIEVNIIENKPIYAIYNKVDTEFYQIDSNGVVLRIVEENSLPYLITEKGGLNLGDKISDVDYFLVDLIFDLYNMQYITYGEKVDNGMKVEIANKYKVIFPLFGKKEELIGALNVILANIKTNSESEREAEICLSGCTIDLRYNNPVVSE